MSDGTTDKFKKQPRRKGDRGRSVAISPEARKAYEDEIKARAERETSYLAHLGERDGRTR